MKVDSHTPCLACPAIVRNLYATAQVVLALLDEHQGDATGRELEAQANLQIALMYLTPFIEAHLENQDHALSVELAPARNPRRPGELVLDRVLPFGSELES